jgi:hypothetical protein
MPPKDVIVISSDDESSDDESYDDESSDDKSSDEQQKSGPGCPPAPSYILRTAPSTRLSQLANGASAACQSGQASAPNDPTRNNTAPAMDAASLVEHRAARPITDVNAIPGRPWSHAERYRMTTVRNASPTTSRMSVAFAIMSRVPAGLRPTRRHHRYRMAATALHPTATATRRAAQPPAIRRFQTRLECRLRMILSRCYKFRSAGRARWYCRTARAPANSSQQMPSHASSTRVHPVPPPNIG